MQGIDFVPKQTLAARRGLYKTSSVYNERIKSEKRSEK